MDGEARGAATEQSGARAPARFPPSTLPATPRSLPPISGPPTLLRVDEGVDVHGAVVRAVGQRYQRDLRGGGGRGALLVVERQANKPDLRPAAEGIASHNSPDGAPPPPACRHRATGLLCRNVSTAPLPYQVKDLTPQPHPGMSPPGNGPPPGDGPALPKVSSATSSHPCPGQYLNPQALHPTRSHLVQPRMEGGQQAAEGRRLGGEPHRKLLLVHRGLQCSGGQYRRAVSSTGVATQVGSTGGGRGGRRGSSEGGG